MVTEGDIPGNSVCENAIFIEDGDEVAGSTQFSKVPDVEPCESRYVDEENRVVNFVHAMQLLIFVFRHLRY